MALLSGHINSIHSVVFAFVALPHQLNRQLSFSTDTGPGNGHLFGDFDDIIIDSALEQMDLSK